MMEDWEHGGFGLYIHWPFCAAKCPYCDFNSHVAGVIDQQRWREAYLREIDRIAATTKGRRLDTVFFGGGTPSLMVPETVAAVLDRVRARWRIRNDLEVTLEANPTSSDAARFRAYADAGVNRLSLGIQALNDRDLKRLGRTHTAAEARKAFDIARDSFDRVSFDLIYARQDQEISDWKIELSQALGMAADHLSLYQLTIEEGTAFHARHVSGGLRGLPDDNRAAELYELTTDACVAAGMTPYEISNLARSEAWCQHNLIYWRYGDYAGIGPGAHGRLTHEGRRFATEAIRSPGLWLERVLEGGRADSAVTELNELAQADEMLLMGLRLTEGICLHRFEKISGKPLNANIIADLESAGWLSRKGNRIAVSQQGRLLLNPITAALLVD
jgi:putative oxygen-independent coproporphyrinogen III oxidase